MGFKSEFWLFVWEVVKIIIISLAIIIPIRYYFAQPFFVKGASMEPNFLDGDYLVICEICYRLNQPQRGDVVVFRFPGDESQFFIKRIIGLPGETLELRSNQITIRNQQHPGGFVLQESFYLPGVLPLGPDATVRLDDNEYFVLGDNRNASSDSRLWGSLNRFFIIGKAWLRAWPVDRWAQFTPIPYSVP